MCLNFPPSVSILICSQVIGRESKEIVWHMKRLNDYGILWNVQMFPETPTRNTKKPSAVVTLSVAGLGFFFFFFLLIFIVQAGSFETSLNKLQRSSARKILSVVPFTGLFEELENKKLKSTKLKFPVYYFADWTIYYFDFVQRKRNRSRNCLLSENVTNCRNNLIKAKSYLFESVNWVTELINNGQRSWTFRV